MKAIRFFAVPTAKRQYDRRNGGTTAERQYDGGLTVPTAKRQYDGGTVDKWR
ncbi:hypothetical protein [Paenibacillus senegalensis]|uniref:hypothetical protein n=1 Tax=Paenibacillus senegalensis TaxID=1465766 RepID=UPI0012F8F043|nr:hypothetical protein [Paenibacillus senegalensis]